MSGTNKHGYRLRAGALAFLGRAGRFGTGGVFKSRRATSSKGSGCMRLGLRLGLAMVLKN